MKKWIGTLGIAVVGVGIGLGASTVWQSSRLDQLEDKIERQMEDQKLVRTNFTTPAPRSVTSTGANVVQAPDFIDASAHATPAVVHIKSYFDRQQEDPFGGLFGDQFHGRSGQAQASGSGVIISSDGYITTNNHVIRKADKVEVILNDKRSYVAEVVGLDPTTDLALLKIDAPNLSHLAFGNSDDVVIGEWVLAVGNPFNLTSTVTAGIVSAKGRSLNLLDEEFAIESFIQTDAAVNPGNSGGALINTDGLLVGINTAIASETGSFSGYSFAVPANIVRKVMEDLREYGEVQRGIIGVQIQNINAQFAEEQDLNTLNGAYVGGIIPGGAAEAAGIRPGDIIVSVNSTLVNSASELQEAIGTYRPGNEVSLRIVRDKKEMLLDVVLRNREGNTELGMRREDKEEEAVAVVPQALGADLEQLTYKEKNDLGLDGGVKVVQIEEGALAEAGIEEGFIITRINKQYVETPGEVEDLMKGVDGGILIEGVTTEGKRRFYAFDN